jgi:hypothetical protein
VDPRAEKLWQIIGLIRKLVVEMWSLVLEMLFATAAHEKVASSNAYADV